MENSNPLYNHHCDKCVFMKNFSILVKDEDIDFDFYYCDDHEKIVILTARYNDDEEGYYEFIVNNQIYKNHDGFMDIVLEASNVEFESEEIVSVFTDISISYLEIADPEILEPIIHDMDYRVAWTNLEMQLKSLLDGLEEEKKNCKGNFEQSIEIKKKESTFKLIQSLMDHLIEDLTNNDEG